MASKTEEMLLFICVKCCYGKAQQVNWFDLYCQWNAGMLPYIVLGHFQKRIESILTNIFEYRKKIKTDRSTQVYCNIKMIIAPF